jgi:hypothetical protein
MSTIRMEWKAKRDVLTGSAILMLAEETETLTGERETEVRASFADALLVSFFLSIVARPEQYRRAMFLQRTGMLWSCVHVEKS